MKSAPKVRAPYRACYPTLLALALGSAGPLFINQHAHAASCNRNTINCQLSGRISITVLIDGAGATGKAGAKRFFNGGEGESGGAGKNRQIYAAVDTWLEARGSSLSSVRAALHASASGGSGGNGGHSTAFADGLGGSGGRGGTLTANLQGTFRNTASISGAHAIALFARGGAAGQSYHNSHKGKTIPGAGGRITITGTTQPLNLSTIGASSHALLADAGGGRGGDGRKLAAKWRARGGDGAHGGNIDVNVHGNITTSGAGSKGLYITSTGGHGGTVFGGLQYSDGAGGTGGTGGAIKGSFGRATGRSSQIDTRSGIGIDLNTGGGYGGEIENLSAFNAPDGGRGGKGGSISFTVQNTAITTRGAHNHGVRAQSSGGAGFWGGASAIGRGGSAGPGGDAGSVTLNLTDTTITTHGNEAHAAAAIAEGGAGHTGGKGGFFSRAGDGSQGGKGGSTSLTSRGGQITTHGRNAFGLFASSAGGNAGDGGAGGGIVGIGGNGGKASSGGTATINNASAIRTHGEGSHGIFVQTVGGGGGILAEQKDRKVAIGGLDSSYSPNAHGGAAKLVNSGSVTTSGKTAHGLLAQSIGGGGGSGGAGTGLIAIGGAGQTGGDAGRVVVQQDGHVVTHGEESYGVMAQSVGGGGGYGGNAFSLGLGIAVGVGGRAGHGGAGERVTLSHTGTTTTTGLLSTGIMAQSIGGGGGKGGQATAFGQLAVTSFTLGASGGSGGDGGRVDLSELRGAITTSGDGAYAIHAQSVGDGGNASSYSLVGISAIALGGKGGTGGHGGPVNVVNNSQINTTGADASGIVAQSVGGGGGSGGRASGATIGVPTPKGSLSATIALGGSGGQAGHGRTVTVANHRDITTHGHESRGILAQSVGGGGGIGGSSAVNSLTISPGVTVNFAVSLGGKGGAGGNGGSTAVSNTGHVQTHGVLATALTAQSVGGGGGVGAAGSSNTMALSGKSMSLAFTLGGAGGKGGNGGSVDVTQSGHILTHGEQAGGILAQSIGGGGGHTAGSDGNADADNLSLSLTLGGRGGDGGKGQNVVVDVNSKDATLETRGQAAIGLVAQSVGGGGGTASLAQAGEDNPPKLLGAADFIELSLDIKLGGSGGKGGSGGSAIVRHSGRLLTHGDQAHGMVVQSVGGGGGIGAAVKAESDGLLALELGIGGRGGTGGHGGQAVVENHGGVQTLGDNAIGIMAQSIGGGGGFGGVSANSGGGIVSIGGVSVSGSGGSSGNGGRVRLDNAGSIQTAGDNSFALLAQSIGGGGGVANIDKAPTDEVRLVDNINVSLGGSGSTGGNGGEILLAQSSTGSLLTSGHGAHAIVAQSVGGGGGIATTPSHMTYVGTVLGGKGGAGGHGGAVNVNVDGTIETRGDGAYGVLAQSVGGGGGISGNRSVTVLGAPYDLPQQHPGSHGNGGNISINAQGSIDTYGRNAPAIFAQSIGGGGGIANTRAGAVKSNGSNRAGGSINVLVSGNVHAHGTDSAGLFAQSVGANDAAGQLRINVASGGHLSGGLEKKGAGVHLQGGNGRNLINIEHGGTITAKGGQAILTAEKTRVAINNHGRIAGSVDISSHTLNQFTNQAGGRFDMGTEIRLGKSGLENLGTINPGGAGIIATTQLFSPLVQRSPTRPGSAPVFEVDANFRDKKSDLLSSAQPVELGGTLKTLARYPLPNRALTVFESTGPDGNLKKNNLESENTLVYSYAVSQPTTEKIAVSAQADFLADNPALSDDQRNLATYLQETWALEPTEDLYEFSTVFDQLVDVTDMDQYRNALDTLASDAKQGPAAYIPLTSRAFITRMMSCPQFEGNDTSMREGDCVWGRFLGNHTKRDPTSDTGGFTVTSQTYQFGGQKEVGRDWFVGGSVSYESSRHRVQGAPVRTDGDAFDIGLVVKRQMGPWLFAIAANAGYGKYDSNRSIRLSSTPFHASSRWRTQHVSTRLRASYVHAMQNWYLKPILDVDATYQRTPAYNERGAGPLNLHLDSANEFSVMITPALEVGGRIAWKDSVLRPYFSAGASWISDNDWDVNAHFEGDPRQQKFTLVTDLPRTFGDLKTGIVLTRKSGLELKAEYGVRVANNYLSQTGSLRLAVPF